MARALSAFTDVAIDGATGDILVMGVSDPALGGGSEVHVAIVDVDQPLRRCQKLLDEAGTNPWDDTIPNTPANPVQPAQTFPPFGQDDEVYVVGVARSDNTEVFVWGEKCTLHVLAQADSETKGPIEEVPIIVDPA